MSEIIEEEIIYNLTIEDKKIEKPKRPALPNRKGIVYAKNPKELISDLIKDSNKDLTDEEVKALCNKFLDHKTVQIRLVKVKEPKIKKEKVKKIKDEPKKARGRPRKYERGPDDKEPNYNKLSKKSIEYRKKHIKCDICGDVVKLINLKRHKATKKCMSIAKINELEGKLNNVNSHD